MFWDVGYLRIPRAQETSTLPDPTVDFETKCWERDWRLVTNRSYISRMISRFNNAVDVRAVGRALGKTAAQDVIDAECIGAWLCARMDAAPSMRAVASVRN